MNRGGGGGGTQNHLSLLFCKRMYKHHLQWAELGCIKKWKDFFLKWNNQLSQRKGFYRSHFVCSTPCQWIKANYIKGLAFHIFGMFFTPCFMSNIQCRWYFILRIVLLVLLMIWYFSSWLYYVIALFSTILYRLLVNDFKFGTFETMKLTSILIWRNKVNTQRSIRTVDFLRLIS